MLDIGLYEVGWTLYPVGTALGDVGLDHCGFEFSVAEEFLDSPDIGAGFE